MKTNLEGMLEAAKKHILEGPWGPMGSPPRRKLKDLVDADITEELWARHRFAIEDAREAVQEEDEATFLVCMIAAAQFGSAALISARLDRLFGVPHDEPTS